MRSCTHVQERRGDEERDKRVGGGEESGEGEGGGERENVSLSLSFFFFFHFFKFPKRFQTIQIIIIF